MLRDAGALALVVTLGLAAAGCTRGDAPGRDREREEPGPTLAAGPPPADWTDVRSPTGLVYSVPPRWLSGDAVGDDPLGGSGRGAGSGGVDWGSGFVTGANAVADRGYCGANDRSFRVLSGITEPVAGSAHDQAASAARSLADSIDLRFTRNGAESEVPEPVKIGVSGTPAWHVTVRGTVRPPRDECTPPVIRVEAIAVDATTGDGSPAAALFVLMADEGEAGVVPAETIDAVLGTLRYENSV